jgi:hypothetical protein
MGGLFDFLSQYSPEDYNDPLGYEKYLEEERRKKEEQEKQFNLLDTLGIRNQDSPSLLTAFNEALGVPLALAKKPIDWLASKASGLNETRPAEELLRAGLFPDVLPGDVSPVSKPSMDFPLGSERTSEDVEDITNISHQLGGAGESIAGMALNPAMYTIPKMPRLMAAGIFGPGMAESAYSNVGKGEYGKAAIDALALTGLGVHGIRDTLKGSEVKQSSEVVNERPISEPIESMAAPKIAEPAIRENFQQNFESTAQKLVDDILPEVSNTFGEDIGPVKVRSATIQGDTPAYFDNVKGEMVLDPSKLGTLDAKGLGETILHELTHRKEHHDIPGINTNIREDPTTGERAGLIPIGEGKWAETDPLNLEHTVEGDLYRAEHGSANEHLLQTAQESLMNNPDILGRLEQFHNDIRGVRSEEFNRGREPINTYEENLGEIQKGYEAPIKKETPEKVEETSPSEKVVSEPANILRKILQETGLTKFNKSNLVESLKAKGVEVPEEVKAQLEPLLSELEDRGWVSKKIAGTYTLLVEPPKRVTEIFKEKAEAEKPLADLESTLRASLEAGSRTPSEATKPATVTVAPKGPTATAPEPAADLKSPSIEQTIKEKLTPEEQKALAFLFGGKRAKGKANVPEEVRLAQEAASRIVSEKKAPSKVPTEAVSEKVEEAKTPPTKEPPPSEPVEELGESGGEGKPVKYKVTLSDGSEHLVKGTSIEDAKANAEEILSEYNSTKTIDNIERHLTSLERAAKDEISPLKTGTERVSEDVAAQRKLESENVREFGDLVKKTESLKKAQVREKLAIEKLKLKKPKIPLKQGGNPIVKSLVDLAQTVKAFRFTGDLGHLNQQGKQGLILLALSDPKSLPGIFKSTFKQGFSEKAFTDFHTKLEQDPKFSRFVNQFSFDVPGMGKFQKEEVFAGGYAENIPGVGKYYVRPFDRLYTGGLNAIRYVLGKNGIKNLEDQGSTMDNSPEAYRSLARGLNVITRRGDIKPVTAQAMTTLNAIFGAPRNRLARMQQFELLLEKGPSGKLARRGIAAMAGYNLLMFGALKAIYGNEIEFVSDPDRSDFLKIRKGNITVDPWAGLGTIVRTTMRPFGYASMAYDSKTGVGREVPLSEAIGNDIGNMLAPAILLTWELATGKDVRGYLKDKTTALWNLVPMSYEGTKEIAQEGKFEDLIFSLMEWTGDQVNVFNREKAQEESDRLKRERGLPVSRRRKNKHTYSYQPGG